MGFRNHAEGAKQHLAKQPKAISAIMRYTALAGAMAASLFTLSNYIGGSHRGEHRHHPHHHTLSHADTHGRSHRSRHGKAHGAHHDHARHLASRGGQDNGIVGDAAITVYNIGDDVFHGLFGE